MYMYLMTCIVQPKAEHEPQGKVGIRYSDLQKAQCARRTCVSKGGTILFFFSLPTSSMHDVSYRDTNVGPM